MKRGKRTIGRPSRLSRSTCTVEGRARSQVGVSCYICNQIYDSVFTLFVFQIQLLKGKENDSQEEKDSDLKNETHHCELPLNVCVFSSLFLFPQLINLNFTKLLHSFITLLDFKRPRRRYGRKMNHRIIFFIKDKGNDLRI